MSRLLAGIIGHDEIIEKMLQSFAAGKPGQTFLFVGPEGIGKKQVALGLAQALLCPESSQACGACRSCLRMQHGNHEGLKVIQPQGPQIKIEQAREVIEFLSLRSLSGHRVIVIDQSQTLNPQAANSLLKILEEPPAGTFFFLMAPSVAGLLPTIRSRSRIVQFKPLTAQQLGQKIQAPQWALKAASGSFAKLAQLQEGPEQELRQKAIEILKVFLQDRNFLMNDLWRQEMKDRNNAGGVLSYWVGFFRDALFLQEDAKTQLLNVDQPELLKELAGIPREQLLSLIQSSMAAERAVRSQRDTQLVMEQLWVENHHRER